MGLEKAWETAMSLPSLNPTLCRYCVVLQNYYNLLSRTTTHPAFSV